MSANSILAVDDDPTILGMIAELLGYEGYHINTTGSGREALAQAALNPPALILLDLMMPEMSGWQVIAGLRSNPRTRSIPVVLLSARRDLASTAQDLAVEQFLEKPFELDELLRIVELYLGQPSNS